MAMVDLAARETARRPNDLICLADIAQRQQLSQSYLEQLFGKLRRADLVCSARGPGGGYRLARPPSEIAIADIVAAVDEQIAATRCVIGSGGCLLASAPAVEAPMVSPAGSPVVSPAGSPAESPMGGEMCHTHDLWSELGRQIALFLCGITLADVVLGRVVGRAIRLPPAATAGNVTGDGHEDVGGGAE
ncbi:MAG: Rrf2 family transcriptional regulator [Rhodopila sp.]|nr:Rrf2 family transcriptional regulator [Rhodopila sp.]